MDVEDDGGVLYQAPGTVIVDDGTFDFKQDDEVEDDEDEVLDADDDDVALGGEMVSSVLSPRGACDEYLAFVSTKLDAEVDEDEDDEYLLLLKQDGESFGSVLIAKLLAATVADDEDDVAFGQAYIDGELEGDM